MDESTLMFCLASLPVDYENLYDSLSVSGGYKQGKSDTMPFVKRTYALERRNGMRRKQKEEHSKVF